MGDGEVERNEFALSVPPPFYGEGEGEGEGRRRLQLEWGPLISKQIEADEQAPPGQVQSEKENRHYFQEGRKSAKNSFSFREKKKQERCLLRKRTDGEP